MNVCVPSNSYDEAVTPNAVWLFGDIRPLRKDIQLNDGTDEIGGLMQ